MGDSVEKIVAKQLAFAACVLALVIGVAVFACSRLLPSPRAGSDRTEGAAVTACQKSIRASATNPSAAKIPFPRGRSKSPDGWLIYWPADTGLRLQNGYGAMIDAVAICNTDPSGSTVTALVIEPIS